jgi:hypothetical protein
MINPIHLALNCYFLLLFGQFWSYVWFPLLLWSTGLIARLSPWGVLAFAVSLALLILTNMAMVILFGPLAVLYGIWLCVRHYPEQCMVKAMQAFTATLLGFALAGYVLFPGFTYSEFTIIDEFVNFEAFKRHFPAIITKFHFFGPGVLQPILAWGFTGVFLLMIGFGVHYLRQTKERTLGQSQAYFWMLAVIGVLFMNTQASEFMWDSIPNLFVIQDPWRFYTIACVGITFLITLWFSKQQNQRVQKIVLYSLLVFFTCVTLANAIYARSLHVSKRNDYDTRAYEQKVEQYGTFLPAKHLMLFFYTNEGLREIEQGIPSIWVQEGEAEANVLRWDPRHIELQIEAKQDATIAVRQFLFPGWRAYANGESYTAIRADGKRMHILVDVNNFNGTITLKMEPLWPELFGQLLSILALIITLVLFTRRIRAMKYAT